MLLTNGRVYTLDPRTPAVDTLVLRDGHVTFAGRRGDVNVPASERVIDLGGRAVLPGLVDAHGHLMYLARGRLTLNAAGATSEDAIARMVGAAAANAAPGAWLGGRKDIVPLLTMVGGEVAYRRAASDTDLMEDL